MTRAQRRSLAANLLFVSVIAAGVAWFLARTDQTKIAEQTAPYMALRIEDRDIQQVLTSTESGRKWRLLFTTTVESKSVSCDQVQVAKRLQRLDDPRVFASEESPTREVVRANRDRPVHIRAQLGLPGPMPAGAYVLTMTNTCYTLNPDKTLSQFGLSATATVCFLVEGREEGRGEGREEALMDAPLGVLAQRCVDELSGAPVRSSSLLALAR